VVYVGIIGGYGSSVKRPTDFLLLWRRGLGSAFGLLAF
jgi:hypothetical protein